MSTLTLKKRVLNDSKRIVYCLTTKATKINHTTIVEILDFNLTEVAVTTKHICCQTRRLTASDNIGWSKDISIWTNTAKLSRSDWHGLVIEFNCRSIHSECQATLTKLLSGIFHFQNETLQHWPTRYWAEPLLFVQQNFNLTNV